MLYDPTRLDRRPERPVRTAFRDEDPLRSGVLGSDFEVLPSRDYSEAYRETRWRCGCPATFACAAPIPAQSVRKLTVT